MARAKLWYDLMIIFHARATHISTKFELWVHTLLCEADPGSHLCSPDHHEMDKPLKRNQTSHYRYLSLVWNNDTRWVACADTQYWCAHQPVVWVAFSVVPRNSTLWRVVPQVSIQKALFQLECHRLRINEKKNVSTLTDSLHISLLAMALHHSAV